MAHSAPHSLTPAQGFVLPALSQRALTFAAIVAFHIVVIYLFASGLGSATLKVVTTALTATLIDSPPESADPPPQPAPTIEREAVVDLGPLPDYPINVPSDDGGTALRGVQTLDPPPVSVAPPPPAEPIHLIGRNQLPNTENYYPPQLIREGVEGAANIRVCVDERGRRQGDPTVTESSGNARLDRAAIDVGRDGRYARAARGETFVPNCYAFRIVFKVTQR
jgi:TonB family protein